MPGSPPGGTTLSRLLLLNTAAGGCELGFASVTSMAPTLLRRYSFSETAMSLTMGIGELLSAVLINRNLFVSCDECPDLLRCLMLMHYSLIDSQPFFVILSNIHFFIPDPLFAPDLVDVVHRGRDGGR